jgi:nitronate monooxygenase
VGTKQSWLEQTLNKNKTLKVKMIRYMIGSNAVTKAATEVTYKTVWVAGPTIENTTEIAGISQIVNKLCL